MKSDSALLIAQSLLEQDPHFGGNCVGSLISKFSASQNFETASQLAAAAPEGFRANWTRSVFRAWAQSHPKEAVQALDSIQNRKLRESVFKSVVNGWAAGAPASLAAYAETLPAGTDHQLALRQALDNWSLQDPADLGQWLNTLPAGADFDEGVSLMLAKADGANIAPQNAMKWVEAMSNPKLKFESFAHVIVEWHRKNPKASQQYVANAKWLSDAQREKVLKLLDQPSSRTF